MSNAIPICRVAARRREFSPRSELCALNPFCAGDTSSMFGVPLPFCHNCMNWLPESWQQEMYRQCRAAKGWQYSQGKMSCPTFNIFTYNVQKVMGIIKRSKHQLVLTIGTHTRKMGSSLTWEVLGVEPRCEFTARFSHYRNHKSAVLKTYEDDRRYLRV